MIGGTAGSETKLCQPSASQSKMTQTRSSSLGIAEYERALELASWRLLGAGGADILEETGRGPRSGWLRVARRGVLLLLVGVSVCLTSRSGVPTSLSCGSIAPSRSTIRTGWPLGLGDVHVQPQVVLSRDHLRRAAGPVGDLGVVERRDHVGLGQRPGLGDGRGPQPDRGEAEGDADRLVGRHERIRPAPGDPPERQPRQRLGVGELAGRAATARSSAPPAPCR